MEPEPLKSCTFQCTFVLCFPKALPEVWLGMDLCMSQMRLNQRDFWANTRNLQVGHLGPLHATAKADSPWRAPTAAFEARTGIIVSWLLEAAASCPMSCDRQLQKTWSGMFACFLFALETWVFPYMRAPQYRPPNTESLLWVPPKWYP